MKSRFFQLARVVSKKSQSDPQMGCVLVSKNKVISVGFNDKKKTHPFCKTHSNRLHAELHALIGIDIELLRNAVCYVYREYKNGKPAMAKPCPVCEAALIEAGVKVVHYTTNGGHDTMRLK